ncbi:MAG: hypothetical protein ACI9RU_003232 [Litorivivens sp.]
MKISGGISILRIHTKNPWQWLQSCSQRKNSPALSTNVIHHPPPLNMDSKDIENHSLHYRKDSKADSASVSFNEDKSVSGTIASSSINLVNTVLGTGMLSLPFVFSQLGVVQGIVMLSIAVLLAILSLSLLSQAAQKLNSRDVSFNSMALASFPHISIVMDAAILITCFGSCVSYLIVGLFSLSSNDSWFITSSHHWNNEQAALGYSWYCYCCSPW